MDTAPTGMSIPLARLALQLIGALHAELHDP
jgi:hypothetical protein